MSEQLQALIRNIESVNINCMPVDVQLIIRDYHVEYEKKMTIIYTFDDINQTYFTYVFSVQRNIKQTPQNIMFLCRSSNDHKVISSQDITNYVNMCGGIYNEYDIFIIHKHSDGSSDLIKSDIKNGYCVMRSLINLIDDNVLSNGYFIFTRSVLEDEYMH